MAGGCSCVCLPLVEPKGDIPRRRFRIKGRLQICIVAADRAAACVRPIPGRSVDRKRVGVDACDDFPAPVGGGIPSHRCNEYGLPRHPLVSSGRDDNW